MDETKITFSAAIWINVVFGRGCRARLELVLLARICERVGVLAVSIVLSPIQNRPCFLPPSTLMMISSSMSCMLGSNSGPWTSLAIELYSVRQLWPVVLLYASGRSLRVVGDIRCRLPLVGQRPCLELGARLASMCHQLRKKQDSYKLCRIEH